MVDVSIRFWLFSKVDMRKCSKYLRNYDTSIPH